jgi:hypothetical protein
LASAARVQTLRQASSRKTLSGWQDLNLQQPARCLVDGRGPGPNRVHVLDLSGWQDLNLQQPAPKVSLVEETASTLPNVASAGFPNLPVVSIRIIPFPLLTIEGAPEPPHEAVSEPMANDLPEPQSADEEALHDALRRGDYEAVADMAAALAKLAAARKRVRVRIE